MNFELTTFWVNILLPILSILIPVFATLYTVNNRIKAQNKENHQPYVVLDSVVDIDKINEFKKEVGNHSDFISSLTNYSYKKYTFQLIKIQFFQKK